MRQDQDLISLLMNRGSTALINWFSGDLDEDETFEQQFALCEFLSCYHYKTGPEVEIRLKEFRVNQLPYFLYM